MSESTVGKLRVVIVDDNRDSADSTAMLVRMWGYEADVAYSGQQALDQIGAFRPDVALIDLGMPEMSGIVLAGTIRALKDADRLLFAVTGNGRLTDHQLTTDAGFDQHLTKPVEPDFLERLLEAVQAGRELVQNLTDTTIRATTLRQITAKRCEELRGEARKVYC